MDDTIMWQEFTLLYKGTPIALPYFTSGLNQFLPLALSTTGLNTHRIIHGGMQLLGRTRSSTLGLTESDYGTPLGVGSVPDLCIS